MGAGCLPLSQHTGKPATPVVREDDRVERGDKVGEADGFISAPVHASASGTVAQIGRWPHPMGGCSDAVRIKVDPFSAQVPRPRVIPSWEGLSREELVAAVKDAGVVGLGGAAFPTHVKLTPPKDGKGSESTLAGHPQDTGGVSGDGGHPLLNDGRSRRGSKRPHRCPPRCP